MSCLVPQTSASFLNLCRSRPRCPCPCPASARRPCQPAGERSEPSTGTQCRHGLDTAEHAGKLARSEVQSPAGHSPSPIAPATPTQRTGRVQPARKRQPEHAGKLGSPRTEPPPRHTQKCKRCPVVSPPPPPPPATAAARYRYLCRHHTAPPLPAGATSPSPVSEAQRGMRMSVAFALPLSMRPPSSRAR
jgi:hypothetical protein